MKGPGKVLIVGAGVMGTGLAQLAAEAGHEVLLFDIETDATTRARERLNNTFNALVDERKLTSSAARRLLSRVSPIDELGMATDADIAIEAISEQHTSKRSLIQRLEQILPPDALLATNTSSLSVTALANGMVHPERLVGMHFFNPAPVMRLAEIVTGLQTSERVAERACELAKAWGKIPVLAKSTPGFIVNRIARPFYAETLALLQEQAATPAVLDACIRGAGFPMGPCELMDLIGHDTNFQVAQELFEANFYDKRFAPSLVQRELVDGGMLGRKTGQGFYRYPMQAPEAPFTPPAVASVHAPKRVAVHGRGVAANALLQSIAQAIADFGLSVDLKPNSPWTGVAIDDCCLALTDGRPAYEVALDLGVRNVTVFDWTLSPATRDRAMAYAVNGRATKDWIAQSAAWLARLPVCPMRVEDTPGLVVARTVAMLINEAADAVQQGVCAVDELDSAMKLGLNFPAGPFEWLAYIGVHDVRGLLQALDRFYRGERYRTSPWLQALAAETKIPHWVLMADPKRSGQTPSEGHRP